jgi:transposase
MISGFLKKGVKKYTDTMNLNQATFIGIDAHPSEHTALALNRFEEKQGELQFENTLEGIQQFLAWLPTLEKKPKQIMIGIEGGGNARHGLLSALLNAEYEHLYEVNPQYTKQQRTFGTRGDKSDPFDAKLIAEVVTRKHHLLPRIVSHELTGWMLSLRKNVWFYEELAVEGARYKNQLYKLKREYNLSNSEDEKIALTAVTHHRELRLADVKKTKRELERTFKKLLENRGDNLTTIPGIGMVTAARFIAHINGIERFSTKDKFIKYAGIAPKERSSGIRKTFIRNNMGKRSLNSIFFYAALIQLPRNPKSKEYYQKKITEGKTKSQALVCLMKVLASLVYSMLKTGHKYKG